MAVSVFQSLCVTIVIGATVAVSPPALAQATGVASATKSNPSAFVYDADSGRSPNIKSQKSAHYESRIASWRDPFTLPHSRSECTKVEEVDHTGVKLCTQYGTQCQWMEVDAWIIVDLKTPEIIQGDINQCHNEAAATGLVNDIIGAALSGGGAAFEAAKDSYVAYFSTCLANRIGNKLLKARIEPRPGWGDWVGC